MKAFPYYLWLYLLKVLLFTGSVQVFAGGVREWTAQTGHTMKGSFVQMQGQQLTLRGEDGTERVIPLYLLSPASRQLAAQLAANPPVPGIPATPEGAVDHRGKHYLLRLTPGGGSVGKLYLLSTDNRVLVAPISMSFGMGRNVEGRYRNVRLRKVGPVQSPEPGVYQWQGRAANEGPVQIEVRAHDTYITLGYQVTLETPAHSSPLRTAFGMSFPRAVLVEGGQATLVGTDITVDQEREEELISDHRIDLTIGGQRSARRLPFSEHLDRAYQGGIQRAEIRGMFAPHRLRITLDGRNPASMTYRSYGGARPAAGFRMGMSKKDHDTPPDSAMLRFDILR